MYLSVCVVNPCKCHWKYLGWQSTRMTLVGTLVSTLVGTSVGTLVGTSVSTLAITLDCMQKLWVCHLYTHSACCWAPPLPAASMAPTQHTKCMHAVVPCSLVCITQCMHQSTDANIANVYCSSLLVLWHCAGALQCKPITAVIAM